VDAEKTNFASVSTMNNNLSSIMINNSHHQLSLDEQSFQQTYLTHHDKKKLNEEDLRIREFERKLQRDIRDIDTIITDKYQSVLPLKEPQNRFGTHQTKRSISQAKSQGQIKHKHQVTFGGGPTHY
jgi:hypothetical protein